MQLEKRAYVEYYGDLLGRYLAKMANLQAPVQAAAAPVAAAVKPGFNARSALGGVVEEFGPASGAVVGAGIASGYGASPLAGAALGYGIGSLPELIAGNKIKSMLKLPLH